MPTISAECFGGPFDGEDFDLPHFNARVWIHMEPWRRPIMGGPLPPTSTIAMRGCYALAPHEGEMALLWCPLHTA